MFPDRHHLAGCLALALLLGLFGLTALQTAPVAAPPAAEAPKPKLAVLLYFDQLRGDYLSRWDGLFGEGGFRRLEKEGTWFQNCHYPYAYTVTAAGHASVATGCSPDRHGIMGNDWYDRAAGAPVYCVTSDRYQRVPPAPAKKGGAKKAKGASPDRLLAPTLADALKAATGGRGRVVALSFKDRAAVLPGGKSPDACFWFDSTTGDFVTSNYYRDRLPAWVESFNRERRADRWRGRTWDRLLPGLDYERYSGPDDVQGESLGVLQGRTFPHPMNGTGPLKLKAAYYGALYTSPFGNDLLLDFAERAVESERLGRHDDPDLLCVSFSSNDAVGHAWGPDSQEVLDTTLRTDRQVERLLSFLDARVGKGRYAVALTADHGICPLPEVAHARTGQGARLDSALLGKRAEAFLAQTFGGQEGDGRWVEWAEEPWVYFDRAHLKKRGVEPAKAEAALAGWLEKQPGILKAYTRTELLAGAPAGDAMAQRARHSFRADRSGDVLVVVQPYHLITSRLSGTTHGTPHPYDTHVPLLVSGPGVRHALRRDAVTPQAASVILARALGVAPPAKAEVTVPAGLFEGR
jgi:hypothetical protein